MVPTDGTFIGLQLIFVEYSAYLCGMSRLNDFLDKVNMTELYDYCLAHGAIVRYAKGETMVKEGEVCRHVGIVKAGYFKYVSNGSAGQECVTGFSFIGDVVTDYVRSFLFDKPSYSSIVAGCDAEVIILPLEELRSYILECNPAFMRNASSILLQEAYRRYLDMHTMTAAERYAMLCERFKEDIHIISVSELASYLAVSRRQLNRIRDGKR